MTGFAVDEIGGKSGNSLGFQMRIGLVTVPTVETGNSGRKALLGWILLREVS